MAARAADLEQVLAELRSVKESLLKQCQDELANSVAKQVVSQLKKSGILAPVTPRSDAIPREHEEIKRNGDAQAPLRPLPGPPAAKPADEPQSVGATPRDAGNSFEGRTKVLGVSVIAVGGSKGDTEEPLTDPIDENSRQVSPEEDIKLVERQVSQTMDLAAQLDALKESMDKEQDKADKVKIDKLRKSIQFMEDWEAEKENAAPQTSLLQSLKNTETARYDTALDICVAVIIICNAIVIGISMDHPLSVWKIIDVFFTCCFIIELFFKFYLHGLVEHFYRLSNCLDFGLVVIDITQLFLDRVVQSDVLKNTPSASMFRVVRLARLVRLVRLARLKIFDDLVAMITGMIGGMTTLVWSVVFFGLIVYITSLLFREFYGNSEAEFDQEPISDYFSTVPQAMMTVFRYFFGDFSTIEGNNLFQIIFLRYGTMNGLFVALLFFIITIGLFNVIAAIFVESTLAAAFALQKARKSERMNDEVLWGSRIMELVRHLFEYNGNSIDKPLSEAIVDLRHQPIYENTFDQFIRDRRVIRALNDLEIGEEDHKYLFDILDNDNTGDIIVSQLSDGVERLRGDPRRSDIICIDLMVRSLQDQANFLVKAAKVQLDLLGSITRSMAKIQNVAVSV